MNRERVEHLAEGAARDGSNGPTQTYAGLNAEAYDALYREHDYVGEAMLVRDLVGDARTLLDVGSGTGRHAQVLDELGFSVTGIDLSPELVERARRRVPDAAFHVDDMRDFDLGRRFDAATILFAALGYVTTPSDVIRALRCVRSHLRRGATLVLNTWYGPAVLASPPTPENRVVRLELDRRLLRMTWPWAFNARSQTIRLRYQLWLLEGERVVDEQIVEHTMRWFFEEELRLMLAAAGFRMQDAYTWPDRDRWPEGWYLGVVACADD